MSALIPNSSNLNDKVVVEKYFKEHINKNPFAGFIGSGDNSVIVLKQQNKGKGDSIFFSMLAALGLNTQSGSGQLSGQEENQTIYDFGVTLERDRFGVKQEEVDHTELRTPLKLRESMRPQLSAKHMEVIRGEVIEALTDTSNRTQDRYLYGSSDANWDATEATALANVDATNDSLTIELIQEAKLKAQLPTTAHKIRPFSMEMDNGMVEDFFVMFVHPRAARDLKRSTDYKEMAYREGLVGGRAPSLVRGSRYLGVFDGVICYQIDEMPTVAGAGNAGIDVAHNVLCGAQAVAYAQGMMPRFTEEVRDHESTYALGMTEFRAIEKMVFNGHDHGLVHVYTSA